MAINEIQKHELI